MDDDSRDGTDALCERISATYAVRLITRRDERGLATAVLQRAASGTGRNLRRDGCGFLASAGGGSGVGRRCAIALIATWRSAADTSRAARSIEIGVGSVGSIRASPRYWHADSPARPIRWPVSLPMRTELLSRAGALRPIGYKIALELIVRCGCRRIVEVPIRFQDRTIGDEQAFAGATVAVSTPFGPALCRAVRIAGICGAVLQRLDESTCRASGGQLRRPAYLWPLIAGNISLTIVIAAGPTSTTKIAGKMKSTSGKINLTAVLAAFSSAI